MLGLFHRVVLRIAPTQFSHYIFPDTSPTFARSWAYQFERHNHQLHDPLKNPVPKMMERSIFKLIHPYNVFPQCVVDSKSTHCFQAKLLRTLKKCAHEHVLDWEFFFSRGVYNLGVNSFRSHLQCAC